MGQHRVKKIALALLAISCTSAWSQTWSREPTSVFGLKLGAPLKPGDLEPCDTKAQDSGPLAFCRTDSVGYSAPFLVGGFPVREFREGMLTVDDGVVSALMIQGNHSDYAQIRALLIERYGAPTKRVAAEVQNTAGAAFKSERLTWIGKRVSIVLIERSGRVDQTAVNFMHNASTASSAQEREQKTKADAAKM